MKINQIIPNIEAYNNYKKVTQNPPGYNGKYKMN